MFILYNIYLYFLILFFLYRIFVPSLDQKRTNKCIFLSRQKLENLIKFNPSWNVFINKLTIIIINILKHEIMLISKHFHPHATRTRKIVL